MVFASVELKWDNQAAHAAWQGFKAARQPEYHIRFARCGPEVGCYR